jgi:hypothetical protein
LDRNSAMVSSAIARRLHKKENLRNLTYIDRIWQRTETRYCSYPAGLFASLCGRGTTAFCCWWCWPLVTTESQLVSVVAAEACRT